MFAGFLNERGKRKMSGEAEDSEDFDRIDIPQIIRSGWKGKGEQKQWELYRVFSNYRVVHRNSSSGAYKVLGEMDDSLVRALILHGRAIRREGNLKNISEYEMPNHLKVHDNGSVQDPCDLSWELFRVCDTYAGGFDEEDVKDYHSDLLMSLISLGFCEEDEFFKAH